MNKGFVPLEDETPKRAEKQPFEQDGDGFGYP